ncbi:MAG: Methyltransferase type 11 [Gemmatimonadetes bacterium]|nr:Methyltransferase type 11 [Gemmatimonadota bacterium]
MSGTHASGDHFSTVSASYAAFRPRYPHALFEFVASIAPRHGRAWDCGAGTGQATVELAEFFDEVVGTDVSAQQIEQAPAHPKIRWLVTPAESTPLEPASVDLVTVAQALHWFDHARFNDEVRRVAAPGAAIAAWSYAAPIMEGDVGSLLASFMYGTLQSYWPPERRYVDEEYRTIPFPFVRLDTPSFALADRWTRAQLAGYTRTWSATTRYVAKHGSDPVAEFERELAAVWPEAEEARRIEWPLIMLAGRVS